MTEAEWFRPIDLDRALAYALPRMSLRQQRLYACACVWTNPRGGGEVFREADFVAERMADDALRPTDHLRTDPDAPELGTQLWFGGQWFCHTAFGLLNEPLDIAAIQQELRAANPHHPRCNDLTFVRSLREVVGNPFRPPGLDSRWRSPDATGLARAIYDDRAYERMPILADALLDAGCDDEDILNHCRKSGPHVRGCWVVDLVLGKQ